MENRNFYRRDRNDYRIGRNPGNSSVIIGGFIIVIGVLMLLKRFGIFFPHWLISWKTLLIAVGILMGVKSGFRDISWIFPIAIGTIFLSNDIFPSMHFGNYIWPVALIFIGLLIVTKGKRNRFQDDFPPFDPVGPKEGFVSGFKKLDETGNPAATASEEETKTTNTVFTDDELECTAIFGGVKRTVVSKNFKGGEIVAVFGGAEIDLTHADINGIVKIEATNVLGGTKLIVPPTWDVQSEMVAIFGGVEDKRRIQPDLVDRNKRLILVGTAFLGGLEIKSF